MEHLAHTPSPSCALVLLMPQQATSFYCQTVKRHEGVFTLTEAQADTKTDKKWVVIELCGGVHTAQRHWCHWVLQPFIGLCLGIGLRVNIHKWNYASLRIIALNLWMWGVCMSAWNNFHSSLENLRPNKAITPKRLRPMLVMVTRENRSQTHSQAPPSSIGHWRSVWLYPNSLWDINPYV